MEANLQTSSKASNSTEVLSCTLDTSEERLTAMVRLFALVSVFIGYICPIVFSDGSCGVSLNNPVFHLRGGLVPQADEAGGDYYEQFELDYGGADKKRVAGATRGFIRSGRLAGLPESDPFKKWLNQHLEKGAEPVSGRIKPFYVRVV